MRRYILLTIPDKDCPHSSLGTRLVPRFVLGPVPGAVPTGPVPGVAPRLVTAPPGPWLFTIKLVFKIKIFIIVF